MQDAKQEVKNRLIEVARLIRRRGTPEQAREAADWEMFFQAHDEAPKQANNQQAQPA